MSIIQEWKSGALEEKWTPRRIIVTPEPNCNLACDHCYFSHEKFNIGSDTTDWTECINFALDHDINVFCAGRIVTHRVMRFCREYLQEVDTRSVIPRLSFVDNGYTIFNAKEFFGRVFEFNVSIDGNDEKHDIQRNKSGSARTAWNAIYKLKEMGFDPLIASCISPITMIGWDEFESEVQKADVPMSVNLTLPVEFTRKNACFSDFSLRMEALKLLVDGIPKMIQVYNLEDMVALKQLKVKTNWFEDDTLPGMMTYLPNGGYVAYRPQTILRNVEFVAHYDGKVKPAIQMQDGTPFQLLLDQEIENWKKTQ